MQEKNFLLVHHKLKRWCFQSGRLIESLYSMPSTLFATTCGSVSLPFRGKRFFMDWLHWHLLDQIATETDQSLLIFSPFCSLVSLLMPACLHQNFEGNLKEHLFGLKKDWKQGKSRSKCGSPKKFLQVSFQLLAWHQIHACNFFCSFQSGAVEQVSSRRDLASV